MNIAFNPENHSYLLDGRSVPSVTQIISETAGHGWQAAQWYLDRGKAIHACAAFIAQGKEFKFDPRLAGYVLALQKFFSEVKPEVFGNEVYVASSLYGFAGTLDLYGRIGTMNFIIDWKHSIDKKRMPLQLGGYSQAVKETFGKEINYGYGVEIHDDGKYKMTEVIKLNIPRNEFLALRTTYRIKERCGTLTTQQKEKDNE